MMKKDELLLKRLLKRTDYIPGSTADLPCARGTVPSLAKCVMGGQFPAYISIATVLLAHL